MEKQKYSIQHEVFLKLTSNRIERLNDDEQQKNREQYFSASIDYEAEVVELMGSRPALLILAVYRRTSYNSNSENEVKSTRRFLFYGTF